LKLAELTLFHTRIRLRRPVRHASHTRSDTDNLLVRCVLEDKTEGFGEGVPREYVTGETVESDFELLKKTDLASQLGPCNNFCAALTMAERLELARVPNDERGCRGNAARCAIELAVLDAYGQHFRQPLSSAVQQLAPELYEPRSTVTYSGAITSARGFKLRWAALGLRLYRFHHIKVKVGMKGYNDPQRLRLIRRLLGPKVDLRVDANEAWSPAEVVERIRELEPYNLTSVEQPVPHSFVHVLADVRHKVHAPLMLDESLCSHADAERAIDKRTCDLFNLRLSKCGGFIRTLRLAQFARRHQMGYQLGCQVGETATLSAAGRHFAAAVAGLRYVEGSFDRFLVCEPLSIEDLTFHRGGQSPALASPGLGITVDPQAVQRVAVRQESLIG
jgi:muconate cycloisomerase